MPFFLLKLLGIGKWLKEAATAAFRWVTASTTHLLIFALCVSLAGNFWLYRGNVLKERQIVNITAEYVKFQAKIKHDMALAKERQDKADQSNIAGQLAAIRQQDAAHVQLEAARRAAVSEFRTAGRMRFEAACRPSIGAGETSLRDNPGQAPTGQADSDLVAIRPEDIEAFSQTELQNAERGEFLRGLVDQGLAIPQSVLPEVGF